MLGLIAGLGSVLVTPLGAGYDEETHLARVWEMSSGVFLPNRLLGEGEHYPRVFYELSYRQDENLTPVSLDTWARQLREPFDPGDVMAYRTRSILFPLVYAPYAVLMAVTERGLGLPAAWTYYLLRTVTLGLYLALGFLAIRVIPFGKWPLAVLGLSPTAVILASTLSPDAVNTGASMLFVAWMLKLALRNEGTLSRRELIVTLVLVAFLCTLKATTIVLPGLLLLVPWRALTRRIDRQALFAGVALSFGILFFAWNLGVAAEEGFSSPAGRVDPAAQALAMLRQPLRVAAVLGHNLETQLPRYLQEMIGITGYSYWSMPAFTYWVYPILIGVALLAEGSGDRLALRRRAILLGVGLLHSLAVLAILYLTFSPLGSEEIFGVQGRYFLPGVPLLVFALTPRRALLPGGAVIVRTGLAMLALVTLVTLGLVYHLPCGDSYYSRGTCYLPRYKNWNPATSAALPVSGDHQITQDFRAACKTMTEIRLWMAAPSASSAEGVVVEATLLGSDRTLGSWTLTAADLAAGPWLRLPFTPWADSDHGRILISIGPIQKDRQQSVALGWTETDEYIDGHAALDGHALQGDLMFQYGCRAGLEALLDRLARPGASARARDAAQEGGTR